MRYRNNRRRNRRFNRRKSLFEANRGTVELPRLNADAELDMDRSGNKVIRLHPFGGRAFSIQTNYNLPMIHRERDLSVLSDAELMDLEDELVDYIEEFGTSKEQAIVPAKMLRESRRYSLRRRR